jgi:hypothetical protein
MDEPSIALDLGKPISARVSLPLSLCFLKNCLLEDSRTRVVLSEGECNF